MDLLRFENLHIPLGSQGRKLQTSGHLPKSRILAVRGPSGAGKSTLLRVLGRLEDRFVGQIYLQERPYEEISAVEWRRLVQYVHQTPITFPGTVRDNLLLAWKLSAFRNIPLPPTEQVAREMNALGLDADFLDRDAQLLSGGERARVALLRHLLSGPQILLLDEPTASLDRGSRSLVLKRLSSWLEEDRERGICLVSHSEDEGAFPEGKILELSLEGKEVLS